MKIAKVLSAVVGCVIVVALVSERRHPVGEVGPTTATHAATSVQTMGAASSVPASSRLYYARPRDCTFICRTSIAEAEGDCKGTVLDCFSCDATSLGGAESSSRASLLSSLRLRSGSRGIVTGGGGFRCLEIPLYDEPDAGAAPVPVPEATNGESPVPPPTGCDYFLNVAEFRMTYLHTARCLCPGDILNGYPLFTASKIAECVTKGLGPLHGVSDLCESGHVLSTADFRPALQGVCTGCGGVFGLNDYGFGECLAA